ncbi:MAG: class I SAM-dependent methyltransferase [Oligoflexia bacterium]|nr:class I SAM-dependent methyltransferase [Oligoflexia bacterium]
MNPISIPPMPFYWRVHGVPKTDNIIADKWPFEFDYEEELGLITQKYTPNLKGYLNQIYKAESNIGYLQDANLLAKPYGSDLFRFINQNTITPGKASQILEIGCGGCTVLENLKQTGHKVTGLDPSPVALKAGKKKNIQVIHDFFPSQQLHDKFDLIFHSDVLEHVPDPVSFLRDHKSHLKKSGQVLISVPDCTESISLGDLSMTLHQHLNYFDEESLYAVLAAAGFEVIVIEKALYGGSLYALGRNTDKTSMSTPKPQQEKFVLFNNRAQQAIKQFTNYISTLESTNNSLGFYVPLRSFPYLAFLNKEIHYRIFDDTDHWHHKFFDGYDRPIENRNDLMKKPVKNLIIMSLTFGDIIEKKIRSEMGSQTNIIQLREILDFSV